MMSRWIYPGDDIVSKDQNTKKKRSPKLPVPVLITNKKNDSFDHSLVLHFGKDGIFIPNRSLQNIR